MRVRKDRWSAVSRAQIVSCAHLCSVFGETQRVQVLHCSLLHFCSGVFLCHPICRILGWTKVILLTKLSCVHLFSTLCARYVYSKGWKCILCICVCICIRYIRVFVVVYLWFWIECVLRNHRHWLWIIYRGRGDGVVTTVIVEGIWWKFQLIFIQS